MESIQQSRQENVEEAAIAWRDEHQDEEYRKVLTGQELCIPGLETFAYHNMHTAVSPLNNHYHPHCMEITYISKGMIEFSVGETSYEVKGGDIFFTYPDEIHSTDSSPLSIGEIYWIQLNLRDYQEILFLNRKASQKLIRDLCEVKGHVISIKDKAAFHYLKQAFWMCYHKNEPYMAASYLTLFLQLITSFCDNSRNAVGRDIETSVAYIRKNIDKELQLESLAKMCGLSVSQYKQKFKNQMGIPPRNYINRQKIEAAKTMLAEGKLVTEIAMELGFGSSSYFSVVFKRYAACTPTEYQNNCRKIN